MAILDLKTFEVTGHIDVGGEPDALETWPRTGVPEKPEAWLLIAARRKLSDEMRHLRVQVSGIVSIVEDNRIAFFTQIYSLPICLCASTSNRKA